MALTQAQVKRFEEQAPDGWHFDTWHAICNGGAKQLTKRIPLDEARYLEITLSYREIVYRYRGTKNYHVVLHSSIWVPDKGGKTHSSFGLGVFTTLKDTNGADIVASKRDYKALCKIAATITNEACIDYYRAGRNYDDGIFAPSPMLEAYRI